MDTILPLLVLTAASSVVSEPLSAAIQRRSGAEVYASDFSHYQPVTYVAVPLHKPIPVLHVLSRAPLLDKRRSPAYSHSYRTDHTNYAYSTNHHYHEAPASYHQHAVSTSQQKFYNSPVYAPSVTQSWYSNPKPRQPITESPIEPIELKPMVLLADTSSTNDEPVILYARPNPDGSYTYRKRKPLKKAPPKKKEPVIIRIHKYRIVKDDR